MRRILITLVTLSISLSLISCKKSAPSLPPAVVVTYEVTPNEIPIYHDFVGQVYGAKDIVIRARIEGYIRSILFQEGQVVEEGQELYILEADSFQAAVSEQEGRVAQARSEVVKTKNDLKRIRPLVRQNAVARSELDAAVASYEAAKSSLEAAQANLESTKVKLGYTSVTAPLNGVIGKTKFNVGDIVGSSPENSILNTVSKLDRVRVEFFISEIAYLEITRLMAQGKKKVKAGDVELSLILADGSLYEEKGKVDFLDRSIDPSTGTMLIQSSFPNPNGRLRPGLFATVRARVRTIPDALVVPQRSVTELQGIYQVAVVSDDNKVSIKTVEMGRKIGSFWNVKSGLNPGEKIVYEGLQKIRDGAKVQTTPTEVKFSLEGIGNE